jgi:peptidase C26-like protein
MIKKIKIYHVDGDEQYSNWISNREIVSKLEDADLVVAEGGEDWQSSWYNEPTHPKAYHNYKRDVYERVQFQKAVTLKKPLLGICRNAQGLCVFAGGRLVQHQSNPHSLHKIKTSMGESISITSSHHQAMYPFDMPKEDYKILGWTENMLEFHEDGNQQEMNPPVECEILYFPKINALCIQGHP